MHFSHCGVHRQEFRRLVRGEDGAPEDQPEPVIIGCPTCGVWYFGGRSPGEDAFDSEEQVSAAEERLQTECPDHAHRFEMSGANAR
jgi:hypothetical protein